MTPPKGYKYTELGVLPEDWEVVRLGEVCEIKKGKVNPKKTETIPCVELEHISQDTGMLLGFIDSREQLSIKNSFSKGDVLFGKLRPYLRKFWRASFDGVCSSEIWVLQGKKVSNAFLFYLVQTARFSQIANATCGTKMPRADWKLMQDENFAIPPLAEQEKIAEILSAWDTQIQNFETLIAEKQNLKKGLCQTLLTAKTRFKGFIEDWQVVRLGEVCEMKKGEQLNKIILDEVEGYPVINGGILPSGFTSAYNTFPNTITISEGGNSCGFVNYIQEYFWSGGHCYTLQNLKILDMFLFQVLKHNEKKIQMLRVGSGLPNIQKRDLEKFSISIPSKIEQEKIAEILSEADNEITLLEQKLQSLEIQKKGLMQILLSGKVRVKWN